MSEIIPEIVCPHCQFEHADSWSLTDEGTIKCIGCELEFHYRRLYITKKAIPPPPAAPECREDRLFDMVVTAKGLMSEARETKTDEGHLDFVKRWQDFMDCPVEK